MHTYTYACIHTHTHVCVQACIHTTHACMHARIQHHTHAPFHERRQNLSCTHPLSHTLVCTAPPHTHMRTQTRLRHLRSCPQLCFSCIPVITAIGETQPRPATLRPARPAARPLRRGHAGRKRENTPCCQLVAFGVPLRLHFIIVLVGRCAYVFVCVCMCLNMNIRICVYMFACVCVRVCACVCMCVCVCNT